MWTISGRLITPWNWDCGNIVAFDCVTQSVHRLCCRPWNEEAFSFYDEWRLQTEETRVLIGLCESLPDSWYWTVSLVFGAESCHNSIKKYFTHCYQEAVIHCTDEQLCKWEVSEPLDSWHSPVRVQLYLMGPKPWLTSTNWEVWVLSMDSSDVHFRLNQFDMSSFGSSPGKLC